MTEIVVRKGVFVDASFLAECNSAMAMETEGAALDMARLMRGVTAVFENPGRAEYFIAEIGGEKAGALMVTREWSDWHDAWYIWIQSVYVLPRFRRMGAYRALHGHVLEMARREGAASVRLYVDRANAAAMETYRRLGMEKSNYEMYEWRGR